MKRETLIFFLGILIVLMPFVGVPSEWKRTVYVFLGALLMLIGYQLRRISYLRSIADLHGERVTDVYVESAAPPAEAQELKVGRTSAKKV